MPRPHSPDAISETHGAMSKQNDNAFFSACKKGDLAALQEILRQGVSVNAVNDDGNTGLILAAQKGHTEAVRLLLKAGADVNLANKEDGQTALLQACWDGHGETLRLLLENGANARHKKKGKRTALMYAARSGSADLTRLMLEKGVAVNDQNNEGQTAMMYAHLDRQIAAARVLLAHGAEVDHRDREGKTPLMWAAYYGSIKLIRVLLEHGADANTRDGTGCDVLYYAKTGAAKKPAKMLALFKQLGLRPKALCVGFRIQMQCPECGHPVLVNGPFQNPVCDSCRSSLEPGLEFWKDMFREGLESDGYHGEISSLTDGWKYEFHRSDPMCPGCEALLEIEKVPTGSTEHVACRKCGRKIGTFPAPEWMGALHVGKRRPEQVFGALESGGKPGEPVGGAQSVTLTCAACGGALAVSPETPRRATCDYCGTVQYLPDAVWLALHPATKKVQWFVRFSEG